MSAQPGNEGKGRSRRGSWPAQFPRRMDAPRITLWQNLEIAARRDAASTALHFFGARLSYPRLLQDAEALACWLQQRGEIARGDRVLLHMQNCPQWVVAYYAALRADAVVVPSNPMNSVNEIRHALSGSGAKVVVCAGDEAEKIVAAAKSTDVRRILVVSYRDYLPAAPAFEPPDWVVGCPDRMSGCDSWSDALAHGAAPAGPALAGADDLCLLLYTSGSTGAAKACMHTHGSLMHIAVGLAWWHSVVPGSTCLGVSPMSHIGGINHCINMPAYAGAGVALLPRWRRDLAARMIEHHRIGHVSMAPTAIIDLLSDPDLPGYELSSLRRIASAGAAIADATLQRVDERLGVPVIQSYGLSETAGTTHSNPFEDPRNCLGIPFFNTDAQILDPVTHRPMADGEEGEIAVRGPQLFSGYWERPQETAAAFIETEQGRFFLTGDIGRVDTDGYFWMRDRLKRMINASGFKVSPAEVEGILHGHPAVREACVVGVPDAYRGETVKAFVVLNDEHRNRIQAADIVEWSRGQMAAYKYPRLIEFVDELPKSSFGKVLWQKLQEQHR
ncbi:MAG: AMP-binding protein [Burkholderiaceae bacterium]